MCRPTTRKDWTRSRACSASMMRAGDRRPFAKPGQKHPDHASAPGKARHCGKVIMLNERDSEIGTIAAVGPVGDPPASKYERLIARAKQGSAATTIVVHPCDETSLRGPVEAAQAGIIGPIFVGPAAKISAVAREHGLD